MAANADVVLRKMPTGQDKTATAQDIAYHFIRHGYGMARAKHWVRLFQEVGVLLPAGKDRDGVPLLTCFWW